MAGLVPAMHVCKAALSRPHGEERYEVAHLEQRKSGLTDLRY
jgi:hypothetical protein